ncbi:MAG: exodeoxyribonuclease VII large subunit, partial [Clostridia bacterium]|nr:exodeoxyribonuclease VII large subunit [Clostridia bacterium]
MATMERDNGYTLSVTQLNEYVSGLFRRDLLLQGVRVRGEISGFKRHSSGHLYFSIKDEGALVRCVMFRQNTLSLSALPKDGQSVIVRGSVSLYVKDGQYQLYVTALEQAGEGELYRRFLEMKDALAAEGLFDSEHKKPLPLLPKCMGVVTSPTGAAMQDILQIARRRFPKMNITLYPVRVQGEGAAEEIAHGVREMNRLRLADVLVVGRGGGSLEDLWAFNEPVVARAIYDCEIPVVSAVGHETDFSIADFVADLRAPTPSAAAELCIPEYERLWEEIEEAKIALQTLPHGRIDALRREIDALANAASFSLPRHRLDVLRRELRSMDIS